MPASFSIEELQVIRASLAKRTNEEIAEVLERPVADVIEAINDITGGQADERNSDILQQREEAASAAVARKQRRSIPTKTNPEFQKEQLRKLERQQLKQRAAAVEDQKYKRAQEREVLRLKRRKELDARSYKTKKRDWSQLKSLRIDANTTILIPMDADPEQERRKYHANAANDVIRQKIKDSKF